MKKAKVMLMAIGVFAIVGGALAFKAKKIDGNNYCTTTEGGAFCTVFNNSLKKVTTGVMQYYYATTTSTQCSTNLACLGKTSFDIE